MKKINLILLILISLSILLFTSCIIDMGSKLNYVKITFDANIGEIILDAKTSTTKLSLTVPQGTSLPLIIPRIGDGTTIDFLGWYSEDTKYVPGDLITSDITLSALWEGVEKNTVSKSDFSSTADTTFEIESSPIAITTTNHKTTLFVPSDAVTTDNSNAELIVTTYSIEVSPAAFEITDQSSEYNLAVAGLNCKLTIGDENIEDFNNKNVIISTFIPKGLSKVQVVYNGDSSKSQPIASTSGSNIADIFTEDLEESQLGYSSSTGKLRFSTTHFSEFYVATNAEVMIINDTDSSDISAMTLIEFGSTVDLGNNYIGKNIELLKDCDYSNVMWNPIGDGYGHNFQGSFDGKGHTIKICNKEIDSDFGLFFEIQGDTVAESTNVISIKNFTLNVSLCNKNGCKTWIGGVVNSVYGQVTFSNITVEGSITSSRTAGGIVGFTAGADWYNLTRREGKIEFINCINKADITMKPVSSSSDYVEAGGIVSQGDAYKLIFTNCRNEGQIRVDLSANSTNATYFGFIVGKGNYASIRENDIYMNNCSFEKTLEMYGVNGKEYSHYVFEGKIINTNPVTYTYTTTPKVEKQMIGGYFGTCTINGTKHMSMYSNGGED